MTRARDRTGARKRVIAIASAGGHWNQLMLMRPGFAHHDVTYLTTLPGLADQFGATPSARIPDCNRDTKLRALACLGALAIQMIRIRPHVVISTGALPGVIALALGKLIRARTIWVDSVANAETLSASGHLAARFADLRLSQWQNVAEAEGVTYAGSIL